ncbi:MAG: 3-dehydroquinate synthase family protein, partial [Planktothrix sp.]
YGVINHGEAVGIGMEAAASIAHHLGLCDQSLGDRQRQLLIKTKLPTEIPSTLAVDEILASLVHDKKVKAGKVRFILPTAIGQVTISDAVTDGVIKTALFS